MGINVTQRAYLYIQKQIRDGVYPSGKQLSNRQLAREIGSSFIPVREALSRLASEGLVDRRHGEGFFVASPQRREIVEIYQVRRALECEAVAAAARRIAPAELARLRAYCDQMVSFGHELQRSGAPFLDATQTEKFLQADLSFHRTIIRCAGNRRLLNMIDGLRLMSRIHSRGWLEHDLGLIARAVYWHYRILRSLQRGDVKGARYFMARHIRQGQRDMLAGFRRHQKKLFPLNDIVEPLEL